MVKVLNILTNGLLREGITTAQLEFVRYIDKTDLQIDMALVRNSLPDVVEEFESLGCNIVPFPDRRKQLPAYIWSLFKKMRAERYDVVHVHGSSAFLTIELLTAKLAGVKKRIAHSRNTRNKSPLLDRLGRPLFYCTYTHALACGREAGEFLFGGRPFEVFYNGKDFGKFRFSPNIREKHRNELALGEKLTLGFVGNLIEQKNPLFLLDIVAQLQERNPNIHLVIIGEGPKQEEMNRRCEELQITDSVTFTGRVSNVHELVQACDIMLLPSLYEGLPNVVLEWQIAGLPTLVSEQVTQECKATELVRFLPIDKGASLWADAIESIGTIDRSESSMRACEQMEKAGFEIKECAKRLRRIYLNKE